MSHGMWSILWFAEDVPQWLPVLASRTGGQVGPRPQGDGIPVIHGMRW